MAFFLVESRDLAISHIPRCALTTIYEWLGRDRAVVPNSDPRLMRMTRRVAVLRHPRDRVESAFSLFYWMHDYSGKFHPSGAPIIWEPFVDHVLNPEIPDDEHWMPQSEHIGEIPNIYHKLENIMDWFELYRPGILPYKNKTSRRPSTNYRASELLIKYADDVVLYQGAT